MAENVSIDALWGKAETPTVLVMQIILGLFALIILFNIKKIITYPRYAEDIAKISIQVLFVVGFLTIFYFTHVIDIEHTVFVAQLQYIVSTVYNESIQLMLTWIQPFFEGLLPSTMSAQKPDSSTLHFTSTNVSHYMYQQSFAFAKHMVDESIRKQLAQTTLPQTDDSRIIENNNEVKVRAMGLVVSVLTVVVCIVLMFKFLGYDLNLFHSLFECTVLLLSVMITEYTFLSLVTENFKAADPNLVRFYFFQAIQERARDQYKRDQYWQKQ